MHESTLPWYILLPLVGVLLWALVRVGLFCARAALRLRDRPPTTDAQRAARADHLPLGAIRDHEGRLGAGPYFIPRRR
jgi:hypothetical protein